MSERSDKPIVFPGPVTEEPPKSESPERRAQPRFPFTAAADVYELRSQTRVNGRCSDLSLGGCYVDTLSPFPVGAVVRLRMERATRMFEAAAVVAYAHVQMGMGLAFTEIRREHQEVLGSWIAELNGAPSSIPTDSATASAPEAIGENVNLQLVLNELISLLVRRKVITENEGADLLRRLFR